MALAIFIDGAYAAKLAEQRFQVWVDYDKLSSHVTPAGRVVGRRRTSTSPPLNASAAKPLASLGVWPQPPPPYDLALQNDAAASFLRRKLAWKQAYPLLPDGQRRLRAGRIRTANSRGDREAVASPSQSLLTSRRVCRATCHADILNRPRASRCMIHRREHGVETKC